MKSSNDTLPTITSPATMRQLQQEGHRRRMAVSRLTASEASSTAAATAPNANTMMPMRPIVLSRKRRPGSGGIDRKKLTELLNEALTISMNFDLHSTTNTSDDDADVNDMTIQK